MSSNIWDEAEDDQPQFSRSDRYSRSRFQPDSRETGYLDRMDQQPGGKMWGDSDQYSSHFSSGNRIMSDRTQRYGGGSNYGFHESRTDAASYTRDGFMSSFRHESFENDEGRDYFGARNMGTTGMESEVTWTGGSSRNGQGMDRLTNTATDTVHRFGMESTGQTSTPNVENDLSKFLSKHSSTSYPMEAGGNRFDTVEGGRNRQNFEEPASLIEPEFNSNRTRSPYYQPRNETTHRGGSICGFRQESRIDTTSNSRDGFRSFFRDESFEKDQGRDYFGVQNIGTTGLESEVTWTRERSRNGQGMDRLTNTTTDTVESTGHISTPIIEKDLSKFLSKRRSKLHPMEAGGNRLDTFESGRNRPDIENPTNLVSESNRTRGPYYPPRNETRSEWFQESHRDQSAEPCREIKYFRFGEMSRHTSDILGKQQGQDSSVLNTRGVQQRKMRMAVKRQQSRGNAVDMTKVMKLNDHFSENHTQDVTQSKGAITGASYGKEAPVPPQESQGFKRGGRMLGIRNDSSFKTRRMEGFTNRTKSSRCRQAETLGKQQSSTQRIKKTVPFLSLDSADQGSTLESKLKTLITNLRSFKTSQEHINNIQTIDTYLAKCKLKCDYKYDSLGKIGRKLTFTGSLQVDDVFLARTAGISKKGVKHACYEKAMAVLMTNPLSEILKMEDEGIEKLKMKLLAAEETGKATEMVVAAAPSTPLTFPDKLAKLIHCLKTVEKRAGSPMIEFNNANVSANLIVHPEYKEESTEIWANFCLVKGLLLLDGHLIATAVGAEPKCVRYKTYAKGVEFLKYSPMSVILEGVPADDDYTNLSAHDVLSHRHAGLPDQQTEQKLGKMITELKKMVDTKQPPSNVLQILSKYNPFLVTSVIKKRTRGTEHFAECDLYIDCIHICSGGANKYPNAMKRANEEAVRVLYNSSSDLIFSNFKRITPQDVYDVVEVCEFWKGKRTKTFFRSNCANIQFLKNQMLFESNHDYTKCPRDWERMTVMEQDMYSSDRVNKAHKILQFTATKNFVTMFEKTTTEDDAQKCELFLQGEKLAEATGKDMHKATAKASAKILFKMYQHQPVIKLLPEGDDSKSWYTYESIKEKADKMKAESEDSETDDFIYINDFPPVPKQKVQVMEVDQVEADKDSPSLSHSVSSVKHTGVVEEGDSIVGDSDTSSSTLPVNKWVKKVVEKMIEEYAKTENLEELIFGPGFPPGDQKQIRITASKHRIYCGYKTAPGEQKYLCAYQMLPPETILRTLRWEDCKCGKYALVPKEELPALDDLEQDSFGIHSNLQLSHSHNIIPHADPEGRVTTENL